MRNIQKRLTIIYQARIGEWARNNGVFDKDLVKSLAEELAKNAYEIYFPMEEDYVRQDVKYVAEEVINTNLTNKEMDKIVERYMNSDAYGVIENDDIIYFINEVKREAKNA